MDINGDFLSLMDDTGTTRDDIKVPEDAVGKDIKEKFKADDQFLVTVLSACGDEKAIAWKNMTK